MKRLFIALTYGLWAVSALANAQVRGEDSYIPPDYDVGHPQLISEAKVLLTESELAKKSYNRPRKIAKIQLSEETIAGIKEQIEALLPETPTMIAGDGQPTGAPYEERYIELWRSTFKENGPIINFQLVINQLDKRFDELEIESIAKYVNRKSTLQGNSTHIDFKSSYQVKGTITLYEHDKFTLQLIEGSTVWEINNGDSKQSDSYYLYKYTSQIGGSDTITPDPKEVEKELKKLGYSTNVLAKPNTIGQNPARIDVFFLYEPEFETNNINNDIIKGINKFNDLLVNAAGPSSFYVHSLGYQAAPVLNCDPSGTPCNKLHSFDEVLKAMRESSAITAMRREEFKQADLIIMFRSLLEYAEIGTNSEWTILGKSYNPATPADAKKFTWSMGAVTGNRGRYTTEAIAHEIAHLMNANHSRYNPDWEERDQSNPNEALLNHYFHANATCPGYHKHGYRTFMEYEAVCKHKYVSSYPTTCPHFTCHTVDRFSENGATANVKQSEAANVIIGTDSHNNFTVMNYYAHTIKNYSVEALQALPPVANIHHVSGNELRWEEQCWNAKNAEMNAGVFANAKWWVSVDGSTQHSEVLYDVNRSFCYRPMLNKEYTVKLRVTRQDNLSHTTAFSFTPTLPNIDNLAIRSDLASVYVSYSVSNNITPPSHAYYHIYEKNHGDSKPLFHNVATTTSTSQQFFRLGSAGDRLDYKVKICADIGDCGPTSDVKSVIVNIWS